MARARKSHEAHEEKMRPDGLEPPYSGRVNGHRYVIYVRLRREGDEVDRVMVMKFLARYAAKYFVNKLIGKDTFERKFFMSEPPHNWDHIPMIETSSGIKIMTMGKDFDDILDYEPTERELEFSDEQLDKSVYGFKYGRSQETRTEHTLASENDSDVVPGKPERKPKEPKPSKPKFDTSGYISANDIAAELKVEGREVRGVLRSLKMEKPEHGWSWPKAQADEIKKKVISGLKKK